MDGDTNDSVPASDLALKSEDLQTAIIKKDVMLSGINTQSPVSSVLAATTVATPTVTMPSALSNAINDNIFLGLQSLGMSNIVSELSRSQENSASLFAPVFSNASQLNNQQSVATPQIFLAAAGNNQGANLSAGTSPASLPLQQLLIPVSNGNGVQQFLLPLSMGASGTTGQMQLLTQNGQLLTANVGTPQMNIAMASTGNSVQPVLMVVPPVNPLGAVLMPQNAAALQQLSQQQQNSSSSAAAAAMAAAAASIGLPQVPQLINSQGQILTLTPQLLQQAMLAASQNNTFLGSKLLACLPESLTGQQASGLSKSDSINTATASAAVNRTASLAGGSPSRTSSLVTNSSPSTVLSLPASNGSIAAMTHITPNINQLLPNTISSSRDGVVVDGVNLDEMREFAKQFKIRRLSLGLTQTQVGQALSVTEGPSYSQSAICRFEKLDITPKSAQKIKPVLERWMAMAEERYKNGAQNLSDFIGLEPSKKRKRRTSFTPHALEILNEYFERSTHPSGTEMTELADKLNFDREVIRVWFCNKRQTLKNSVKRLKSPGSPTS